MREKVVNLLRKVSSLFNMSSLCENSMAVFLIVLNASIIRMIYGSNLFYFWQFFYINFFLYVSMKFYEKYRTSIDKSPFPYKFMNKKFRLEIFFFLTSVVTMGISFCCVDLKKLL